MALEPPARGTDDGFLPALVARIETLEQPVVLVLDDFHEITDPGVMRDLDTLLEHAPRRLRLVIGTRSDPPLRLQRLRIAGRLGEIRNADLAFTVAETAELLSALDLRLGHADVRVLRDRTDGWVAGLRLAALSLRDHPDASGFVRSFAGNDRAVGDYLMAEVVSQQSPDALDFLLRTSIVDRVSGPLADALTQSEGGRRRLEELLQNGALVAPLDDHGHWFGYHPLFRELMRLELARRMPGELAGLHTRAGRWYDGREETLLALRHAVRGEDWDLAADVLGRRWLGLVARGEGTALLEVVDQIPPAVVARDAELALALAGILLDAGEDARADAFLTLARGLAKGLPPDRAHRFAVSATATDLYRARSRGHLRNALTGARDVLDDPWDRAVSADVRAFTLAQLGIAEFWAGSADAAADHLAAAAGQAAACGNDHVLLVAHAYGAAADVRSGHLSSGFKRGRQALELAERRGWAGTPQTAMAHMALSVVHLWWHELDSAEEQVQRAEQALEGTGERLLPAAVALMRARLALMRGDPLQALEGLRGAFARAPQPLPDFLTVSGALVEAELRLALGEPERAWSVIAELEPEGDAPDLAVGIAALELASGHPEAAVESVTAFLEGARPSVLPFTTIEARVVEAVARDCLNDQDGALAALERALDLAEPRGYADAIIHFGAPLKSLLRRRIEQGTSHRAFAGQLLAALDEGQRLDRVRWLDAARAAQRSGADRASLPADDDVQRRDRGRDVRVGEHHQDPPEARVPQARRGRQARGRPARPRAAPAQRGPRGALSAPEPAGDATRRTRLAAERTWLAWWRSGIAAATASVAVGGVVPELVDNARAAYVALGCGYALLAAAVFIGAGLRQRRVTGALDEGGHEDVPTGWVTALTVAGAGLALATLVVFVANA